MVTLESCINQDLISFYYVSIGGKYCKGQRGKEKKNEENPKRRRKHSSRDWSRAETIKTHKSAAKKVAPNQTKDWSNSRRLKMLWAL